MFNTFPDKFININDEKIVIRPIKAARDIDAAVALQEEIWGGGSGTLPDNFLKINTMVGGVSAGAFRKGSQLVGLVLSIVANLEGKHSQWSLRLGVQKEARNLKLGYWLKTYQKECCLSIGIKSIHWTFDPLEARNAHINLNNLGAKAIHFEKNMYPRSHSKLHQGLEPNDRIIIRWNLKKKLTAKKRPNIDLFKNIPIINNKVGLNSDTVRIEIPLDIQDLKENNINEAVKWRKETSLGFSYYFKEGFEPTHFYKDPKTSRCFYVLKKKQK